VTVLEPWERRGVHGRGLVNADVRALAASGWPGCRYEHLVGSEGDDSLSVMSVLAAGTVSLSLPSRPVRLAVSGIRTDTSRRFVHVARRSRGRPVGGVTLELRKGLPHRKRGAIAKVK